MLHEALLWHRGCTIDYGSVGCGVGKGFSWGRSSKNTGPTSARWCGARH